MATYARHELVGRGGMAEVWRGQMTTDGGATRTVALKFILPKLADDEALLHSFRTEAQLSMRLSHGNVVQVFDFGQLDGSWFLAMEWVDGTSLWKVLKKAKELGLGAVHPVMAAQLLMAVLDGLHHAHTRVEDGKPLELVHRDVSPDNVLVSWDGQVKVADFGIARATMQGRQETQPGIFKGKLAYGAPEQARAEAVDARADVYASGVMLWELVTGTNPVARNAVAIASGRESIGAFDPRVVDEAFAALLNKAVAAAPSARFASAKAFRDALGAWLRTQPATRMGPAELMAWLFPDRVTAPELKDAGAGTGQWLLRWKPLATQPQLEPEPVTAQIDAPQKASPIRAAVGISIGVGLVLLAFAVWPSSKPAAAELREAPATATGSGPPRGVRPTEWELPKELSARIAEARVKIAALDFKSAEELLNRCNLNDRPLPEATKLLAAMTNEKDQRQALLEAEAALDRGDPNGALRHLKDAESTALLQDKLEALKRRANELSTTEVLAAPPSAPDEVALALPPSDKETEFADDARALPLLEEALDLARSDQLRAAKKKIDECRKVAPKSVGCILHSGSIYSRLASSEGNDPKLAKEARAFYERFLKEGCPGHSACAQVAATRDFLARRAGPQPDPGALFASARARVEVPASPDAAKPPEPNADKPSASADDGASRALPLIDDALALAKSGQLRAAKKKIDECRKVAPTYIRCVLLSGSIYSQVAWGGGNDPLILKQARGFYERFVREACPGHPSCAKVEGYLTGQPWR